VLIHGESGEWISSETPVIALPAKPQEVGAAQTYYRRYNLFALVGIAGDTPDDDGNEANKQATPAPRKLQPPRPPQMTEEGSALYLSGLLEQVTGAKTREDLKSILVRSTTERSAMWDDDREAFKAAFRTAEERIFSEREGKAE
jgi:hypothetical protein